MAPLDADVDAPLRVLIVEDESSLRESCRNLLAQEGHEVVATGRGEEACDLLQRRAFDVALIDLSLPQMSGMDVLRTCMKESPEARVIVMTGSPSVESSLAAVEAGAWHYLPKPFTASHIQLLLGRASHELEQARGYAAASASGSESVPVAESSDLVLLGRSAAFQEMLRVARRVARTNASVLLTGESGSGKEMIAQFVHHHSRRNRKPLVAVNCAALPESLLESEMFGHVKGAFTGAIRDKPGLLEAADDGTLFLDELTEMAPPIQAKLLRVLQDGHVRRVGSESVDAMVDVRFIAATNRDALQAVEDGVLRKDLYYRLGVVPIRVPSLRERAEDVPLLAEFFLSRYWKRHREKNAPVPTFTAEALRDLQTRRWSGNVRELQNLIEHAVVLLEPGSAIAPDDLPYRDDGFETGPGSGGGSGDLSFWELNQLDYHNARDRLLGEFERRYVLELVERCGGNLSRAAKAAGMDRTTLYRLMEKHQLSQSTVIGSRD